MNCIVIDDEPIARMGMEDLVNAHPNLRLLGAFQSTVGIPRFLNENEVDVIFLDIEMPGVNGLEFASHIQNKTLVIFTTAYSQYALESYEVDAVDYLLKPILKERFDKAVDKAASYLGLLNGSAVSIQNTEKNYILIRADRKNIKLDISEIGIIEALKDYVVIHTDREKYISWINLKNFHVKLPQEKFLRVSRSYVVNCDRITAYDNTSVCIMDTEIVIGKTYKEAFFLAFLP